jgi:hypothetical protein
MMVLIQPQSSDQPGSPGQQPDANATENAGTVSQSPALGVSGQVLDQYGDALGNITVTLHMMSYEYVNGNVSDIREADTSTTTTNASGEYLFNGVHWASGVDYCYVSAEKNGISHGSGQNITRKDGPAVWSDIILHVPTSS